MASSFLVVIFAILLVVFVFIVLGFIIRQGRRSSSNVIYVLSPSSTPLPDICPPGNGTTWVEMALPGEGPAANFIDEPGFFECDFKLTSLGDDASGIFDQGPPPPPSRFIACFINDYDEQSATEDEFYSQVIEQISSLNPLPGSVICIKGIPQPSDPSLPANYYETFQDARFYYVKDDSTIVESDQRIFATRSRNPSKSSPPQDDLTDVPRFSFFSYTNIDTGDKIYYVYI